MASTRLRDGMREFSVHLYKICSEREGNVFLSPYSVAVALLLADLGANGETEEQIKESLGAGDMSSESIHRQYRVMHRILCAGIKGATTLCIANKIFTNLGSRIDNDFTAKAKKFYNSGVELLDFIKESEESRVRINTWVAEQTANKINGLLPPGSIGPFSLLVLINGIYFKGNWENPFEKANTEKAIFHTGKEMGTEVDMMNAVQQNVKYFKDDNLGFSAIELPYADSNIAMVFVLPDEIDGLSNLEKKMGPSVFMDICQGISTASVKKVILGIPKFKLELQYQLNEVLQRLGIVHMFCSDSADFSAMLPDSKGICVSDFVHKTFLEVNEEGTEAAAIAVMFMPIERSYRPSTPVVRFIADHPFLFFIKETTSDVILFVGRYTKLPN